MQSIILKANLLILFKIIYSIFERNYFLQLLVRNLENHLNDIITCRDFGLSRF
ncbi:hypothetical protein GLOIN_2v1504501 [Rhizophagus irregularis DAOM 181602=DAOM 197198]|uniref:Uncharacterized protein n=1 Tax=Rhizophagus irregularis (strain DAOM 181602 / DAOM 197198 / MUCL 43194) TaxID=747089 RepID=A0A2P4QVL4_RHIID|nr:hypothetical protein GLOIN_2v1504501 [Rhizophagus irregularis DAOM 181602=DAOM 197198]POG81686.1 hypothetical protein GLOIN_2v1504501 [Rhizophagus irregularis DAOM 181602=DAOM 197198]|eukprot:XP_025188552.1 hypothetical protein GLOIN_2v1504501 [Rhizophagus irregularis DAOM 181602=DAOM 197198]